MCGILFALSTHENAVPTHIWNELEALNTKRGPDSQKLQRISIDSITLDFFSTVLHLRGPHVVSQPIHSKKTGDILCWNGEIFGGLDIHLDQNDTEWLMDRLTQVSSHSTKALLDIFSQIEGPFAFVFWQAHAKRLWFARDCLGRRSLLWNRSEKGPFMLSSVGLPSKVEDQSTWEEVPADGIYCLHLDPADNVGTMEHGCHYPVSRYRWTHDEPQEGQLSLKLPFPILNTRLPQDLAPVDQDAADVAIDPAMEKVIEDFTHVLSESVRCRVADVPFLDSKGAARVAVLFSGGLDCVCLAALADKHLPISEPIDLLNVAFENPRSQQAKQQLQKKNKDRSHSSAVQEQCNTYDTPDRLTGRMSVEELRKIAPGRTWNFVEINVPYEEAMKHRQEIIDRMYPLATVMDLSIAMAFWFAARGKGMIHVGDSSEVYESHGRVLISGLGADEQLGGYSRHREAFRHGGWERLISETQLDVDRISTRNLGRDDRIMSDHGKEVRFPFLCTNVVDWLCRLPIEQKMDMRYGRGIGEKSLLRHVARRLGLMEASRNWKRAIQFGAKTAKMTGEARGEKGQHKLS
ncbi:hypothetical protein EC973_004290 [Apophysomyces ossiformis]|uniref:Glutamine amidotransferase type-2 domain-containing protein n=1 Tax=Apophysomyces ossiformis TaxID=679940 RepID=A0A8H7BLH4_9FUNG|nr:hypothetical protein EC973_004290 [Apophysomyces ossiformis]